MHLNTLHINNRTEEGYNVATGAISLYEMNVDRSGSNWSEFNDHLITGSFVAKESKVSNIALKSTYTTQLAEKIIPIGTDRSISYPLTATISRELVKAKPDTTAAPDNVDTEYDGYLIYSGSTHSDTVFKVVALKNTFEHYRYLSPYYDFDKYIFKRGGIPTHTQKQFDVNDKYRYPGTAEGEEVKVQNHPLTQSIPVNDLTNLIVIPKIFYGNQIKKGSVDLKFYYTGSLLARAQDTRKNGELIETYGGHYESKGTGAVIGMVLYNEGILLITASYNLDDNLKDGYMSPTGSHTGNDLNAPPGTGDWMVDNPKWGYFGAYKSFVTSSNNCCNGRAGGDTYWGPTSSSYSMEFQGTERIPVITMLAHAKKNDLNWSNNPTFISRSAGDYGGKEYTGSYGITHGSKFYKEGEYIPIYNTISSSHDNYSASYAPQTFISKIGIYDKNKELIAIAKLAKPIRKTNGQDYTFKLKLDL